MAKMENWTPRRLITNCRVNIDVDFKYLKDENQTEVRNNTDTDGIKRKLIEQSFAITQSENKNIDFAGDLSK